MTSALDAKVKKYENFLNDKLKADLQVVHKQRDEIYKQIADYLQLKRIMQTLIQNRNTDNKDEKNKIKTQMDLGCNFYCQAVIPDSRYVYILVGYGYFVQMTLEEALDFIEKKTKVLSDKSQVLTKDSAKIKAHIKLVLEGLNEIQNLNLNKTDKKKRNDVF